MEPDETIDDPYDIEAQLAKLEKEKDEEQLLCGICRGPTVVRTRDDGTPWMACNNNCKFPWQTLKQATALHVAAKYKLADYFRPQDGGSIPRCPRHREFGTLMMCMKSADPKTSAIKGHLFFTCFNPQKNGGPCILPRKGRWSLVADVKGTTPQDEAKKKKLEQLFALDGAIRAKRNKEAKNTANNAFAEAEKDFRFGTGVFGNQDDEADNGFDVE